MRVLRAIFPSQDHKVRGKRLADRRTGSSQSWSITHWESPSGATVLNKPWILHSKSSDYSWKARWPGCLGHSRGKDQSLWKPESTTSSQAWRGAELWDVAVVLSLAGWVGRPANGVNHFELESLQCSNQKHPRPHIRRPQVLVVSFKGVTYMWCSEMGRYIMVSPCWVLSPPSCELKLGGIICSCHYNPFLCRLFWYTDKFCTWSFYSY